VFTREDVRARANASAATPFPARGAELEVNSEKPLIIAKFARAAYPLSRLLRSRLLGGCLDLNVPTYLGMDAAPPPHLRVDTVGPMIVPSTVPSPPATDLRVTRGRAVDPGLPQSNHPERAR
jgi:hypothetical protein